MKFVDLKEKFSPGDDEHDLGGIQPRPFYKKKWFFLSVTGLILFIFVLGVFLWRRMVALETVEYSEDRRSGQGGRLNRSKGDDNYKRDEDPSLSATHSRVPVGADIFSLNPGVDPQVEGYRINSKSIPKNPHYIEAVKATKGNISRGLSKKLHQDTNTAEGPGIRLTVKDRVETVVPSITLKPEIFASATEPDIVSIKPFSKAQSKSVKAETANPLSKTSRQGGAAVARDILEDVSDSENFQTQLASTLKHRNFSGGTVIA